MSFTGQDLGMSLCSCYSSCLTRTCLDFCANSCQHTSLALSDSWPSRGRCPVLSRGKETVGMSIRLLDVCMDMWCGVSMSVCPLMENPGMNLCPGFLYTLCVCACRLNVFLMAYFCTSIFEGFLPVSVLDSGWDQTSVQLWSKTHLLNALILKSHLT